MILRHGLEKHTFFCVICFLAKGVNKHIFYVLKKYAIRMDKRQSHDDNK